jgi:hypothetical protein
MRERLSDSWLVQNVLEKLLEEEILSGQFYFPCVLKRFPLFPILSYFLLSFSWFVAHNSPLFSSSQPKPISVFLSFYKPRDWERWWDREERPKQRETDSRWRRATRGSKVFILQGADRIRGLKLGGYGGWATDVVSG